MGHVHTHFLHPAWRQGWLVIGGLVGCITAGYHGGAHTRPHFRGWGGCEWMCVAVQFLSLGHVASDPQLAWVPWTAGICWVFPCLPLTLGGGWVGWGWGGMVAVPDPHFLRRFHDKRSYTDTHILSLCRSLTAKLYFMFVYLPLLCQVLCIV